MENAHCPLDSRNDNTETTLVLNWLTYTGTGWRTTADALLANTAADQARKRRETGHEELAAEYAASTDDRRAA